jgi:hypothetical protein
MEMQPEQSKGIPMRGFEQKHVTPSNADFIGISTTASQASHPVTNASL